MFPIQDSVPSRSVPVMTWALILINAIVFFFELALPQQSIQQMFYLFGHRAGAFHSPRLGRVGGFSHR